jgi:hypothetical protein
MDNPTRRIIESVGACRNQDPVLFTTELPEYEAKAKAICNTCPVKDMCLTEYFWEAAVVVGGTTTKQRGRMTFDGTLPDIAWDRLGLSLTQGGIRGLMLDTSLTEEEAVKVAKMLRGAGHVG